MSGPAYYNEYDPDKAAWLRELVRRGLIAPGEVDERDIRDVVPAELVGYRQCHFFAGVGIWSHALRLAGWPDDRPVWTGSCPCQPFSSAGRRGGFADERHLWPAWFHLVGQCRPDVVFGEQVESPDGVAWLDLVWDDMEAAGYALGAVPFPAAGVGAPHARHRIYLVAEPGRGRREVRPESAGCESGLDAGARLRGEVGELADAEGEGGWPDPGAVPGGTAPRVRGEEGQDKWRPGERTGRAGDSGSVRVAGRPGPANGFWGDADWIRCRDVDPRSGENWWRPVEPGTFPLAHGAPARMVLVCPACQTETVIDESLQGMRTRHGGHEGRPETEVLQPGLHGEGMHRHPGHGCAGEVSGQESLPGDGVQSVRLDGSPPATPPGSQPEEQRPGQHRDPLQALPRRRTLDASEAIDLRRVWDSVQGGLPPESQQDLLCRVCGRVGPHLCRKEAASRVALLRGYGDGIVAPAAAAFIGAYMDARP